MDERIVQFRVGVLVLATLIIVGILIVLFGEVPALIQETKTIYIHFPRAPGVSRDTPVRKSGILIGRVTDVTFADAGGVIVTVALQADKVVRKNEICRIQRSVLGGDAVLEFVPTNDESLPADPVKPGELVVGVVESDPLEVITQLQGDLSVAIRSIATTSEEVGTLARRVTDTIDANAEQGGRIINKAEQVIDSVQQAVDSINSVVGDEELRERLRQSLERVPDLLADLEETFAKLESTIDVAERNFKNMEGLTEPLGREGERLVANIDRAIENLDVLLSDLTEFSGRLSRPEGTLGQLLNNPDLYQNLTKAAANVEQLTRELRPVVRDARAFSDKIARHPEVLGVRGAIQRSSGIK